MSKILNGREISEKIAERLTRRVKKLVEKPKLVIIQVGRHQRSNSYIKRKKLFAIRIGATVLHKTYPRDVKESEIVSQIRKYNKNSKIHGVIVQLPLPKHLDSGRIIDTILPEKDVDGLTSINTKALYTERPLVLPATTRGILTLLRHYGVTVSGKKVVMVGESALVGRPMALALLNKEATVTLCHSKTRDLSGETRRADILIVATGHAGLIKKNYVTRGQVVIDVGITLKGKKVVGDVDFQNVSKIVRAISPVPGGVGPMTVASLFENLLDAYNKLST